MEAKTLETAGGREGRGPGVMFHRSGSFSSSLLGIHLMSLNRSTPYFCCHNMPSHVSVCLSFISFSISFFSLYPSLLLFSFIFWAATKHAFKLFVTALAATGVIWSRYSLVIHPVNYNLFSVNIMVGATAIYQLQRLFRYAAASHGLLVPACSTMLFSSFRSPLSFVWIWTYLATTCSRNHRKRVHNLFPPPVSFSENVMNISVTFLRAFCA